ncbi:hypothetical protein DIPPA_05226 [Diplonema papillatum]|nr:hypothetical protein DIPPA_05226 [Diplonema papillatum]
MIEGFFLYIALALSVVIIAGIVYYKHRHETKGRGAAPAPPEDPLPPASEAAPTQQQTQPVQEADGDVRIAMERDEPAERSDLFLPSFPPDFPDSVDLGNVDWRALDAGPPPENPLLLLMGLRRPKRAPRHHRPGTDDSPASSPLLSPSSRSASTGNGSASDAASFDSLSDDASHACIEFPLRFDSRSRDGAAATRSLAPGAVGGVGPGKQRFTHRSFSLYDTSSAVRTSDLLLKSRSSALVARGDEVGVVGCASFFDAGSPAGGGPLELFDNAPRAGTVLEVNEKEASALLRFADGFCGWVPLAAVSRSPAADGPWAHAAFPRVQPRLRRVAGCEGAGRGGAGGGFHSPRNGPHHHPHQHLQQHHHHQKVRRGSVAAAWTPSPTAGLGQAYRSGWTASPVLGARAAPPDAGAAQQFELSPASAPTPRRFSLQSGTSRPSPQLGVKFRT